MLFFPVDIIKISSQNIQVVDEIKDMSLCKMNSDQLF